MLLLASSLCAVSCFQLRQCHQEIQRKYFSQQRVGISVCVIVVGCRCCGLALVGGGASRWWWLWVVVEVLVVVGGGVSYTFAGDITV